MRYYYIIHVHMRIDSDGSVRAYLYVSLRVRIYICMRTLIYIYTYIQNWVWCTESQRWARAARTCCVKCRCCSLNKRKKKEKNTETPRFSSESWVAGHFGTYTDFFVAVNRCSQSSTVKMKKRNRRRGKETIEVVSTTRDSVFEDTSRKSKRKKEKKKKQKMTNTRNMRKNQRRSRLYRSRGLTVAIIKGKPGTENQRECYKTF